MRGTTLPEVLIALVLAGLALAGTLGTMVQAERSWHAATRLGRMHERLQYAFGTLEPELQMAGFFGPSEVPTLSEAPTEAVLASCGPIALQPLSPAVQVFDHRWPFDCAPQGQGAKSGSDVLLIRRASTRTAAVTAGALSLFGTTADPLPRELIVRMYYVARNADGDPRSTALRVKSLTAIAGKPAFVDTEVMPGIDDLKVRLLPDALAPQSVEISLRATPDAAAARQNTPPARLTMLRRFNLRNAGP